MDKQAKKQLVEAYKNRKITGGVYAVIHQQSGKALIVGDVNLKACRNRFEFSVMTGSCLHFQLAEDWRSAGGKGFRFEVLEELEKKDDQTDREFRADLKALAEMWKEKWAEVPQY